MDSDYECLICWQRQRTSQYLILREAFTNLPGQPYAHCKKCSQEFFHDDICRSLQRLSRYALTLRPYVKRNGAGYYTRIYHLASLAKSSL